MGLQGMLEEVEKIRDFRNVANCHWGQGLNVILMKAKRPLFRWKQWQDKRQTEADLNGLPWREANGFALIGGSRLNSGIHIAAVDFDIKGVSEEAQKKGSDILRKLPITQIEQTVSGGQHWIYHCHKRPKTISSFHNDCALELLGENRLIIMAPSKGYRRLNDYMPIVVKDIEAFFCSALRRIGMKSQCRLSKEYIRSRNIVAKPYIGKNPPCIDSLMRGVRQGIRNETGIRIAAYLLNFKNMKPEKAWTVFNQWNGQNEPPLDTQELHAIFNSASRRQYDFGCEDPLLGHFCKEEKCDIFQRKLRVFKRKVAAL